MFGLSKTRESGLAWSIGVSFCLLSALHQGSALAQRIEDSVLEKAKSDSRVQEALKKEKLRDDIIDGAITAFTFDPKEVPAKVLGDAIEGVLDAYGLNSTAEMNREAEKELSDRRAVEIYLELQNKDKNEKLEKEIKEKLDEWINESSNKMEHAYQDLYSVLQAGAAEQASTQVQAASNQVDDRTQQAFEQSFAQQNPNVMNSYQQQPPAFQTTISSSQHQAGSQGSHVHPPSGWQPCSCPDLHRSKGIMYDGQLWHAAGLICR